MSRPPYVMGIDCGTQSLRVGLFDLSGEPLVFVGEAFPTERPRVSWAEQDPNHWWEAAKKCVASAVQEAGVKPEDVVALSVDATSCTVVPVDVRGEPLHPAILWMDLRAVEQAQRVTKTKHSFLKYVSWVESAEWMIPKALWLKENEPGVYEEAAYVIECLDWLMFKLTGRWTASLNNVTCKWNYVTPEGGWPVDLLKQIQFTDILEKWPQDVLPVGEALGTLTPEAAQELGLTPDTVVAEGGIDAYTAMLGLQVVEPGQMAVVMGSSTCHLALSECGLFESHVWGPYPDALTKGLWVLEGGQTATGSIVQWYRDRFAPLEVREAEQDNTDPYQILDEKASRIPPGSEGLLVLDYWQGNRTPWRDPLARGTVLGLSLRHDSAHFFRAIYEGTAYGTRHILEDLNEAGLRTKAVYACGGGTRSRLWLQIHADVCQVPFHLTQVPDATVLGSAIAAAHAAGLFPSLQEASRRMVSVTDTIQPNPENSEVYDFYFRQYVNAYSSLREVMHHIAGRQGADS